VAQIEVLEEKEKKAKLEIEEFGNSITNKFKNLVLDEYDLGNISSFKNGLNFSRGSKGELIEIVGVKDFQNKFSPDINSLEKIQIDGRLSVEYNLKPSDILVVRSNGSSNLVGRFLFINELNTKTSFSGFTIRIRPVSGKVDAKYLCYYLKTDIVRAKLAGSSKGSNIKSLNQTLLSSVKIPLPPLADQQTIVAEIETIEAQIAVLETEINKIPAEKEAILKKYL